jgi:hypothetical protein
MKTLKYLLALAAVCACLGFAPKTYALDFNDSRDLGVVLFGIPSGDQDREDYVNHLIDMALNSSDSFQGQTFFRSGNDPAGGNYPDAIFDHNGTGNTDIDLGTGGFLYLFAKYDGPNAGSEVWYVGGLTGLIDIPAVGLVGQNYGLSGWTLFNPGETQVPDGGTTAALLGAALAGVSLLRRYIKR